MSTLVYHFDLPRRFPVLEPDSDTKTPAIIERAEDEKGGFLRIVCERLQPDDTGEVVVVLALPLLGIAGQVERLDLDVLGDSSGTHIFLEAIDQRGVQFAYSFGETDFSGWRTRHADANQSIEHRSACEGCLPGTVGPLEPRKLVLKGGASGTHPTPRSVPGTHPTRRDASGTHSARRGTLGTHPAGFTHTGVGFDIGIRTLCGIGDVRLVPTGIA